VRFWDSSAVVAVIFDEPSSPQVRALAEDGTGLGVWWATLIECASAIARRERLGQLDPRDVGAAVATLDGLATGWTEVPPTDRIRDAARRIVSVHDLRAADAFQLAAARAASAEQPVSLPFVTLDDRLAAAARREGFTILGLG
jgi:uncharacterized protein